MVMQGAESDFTWWSMTYPRLAKVDSAHKLTDNHDIHSLHNFALEARAIC